jgi:hypothetical protein
MKMDKETLLKNRFWVGLIAFGPIWLLAFIIAIATAGDKASKNAADIDKTKKKVAGIRDPKNEKFTDLLAKKQKDLTERKEEVWAQAWKGQADLMTWPNNVEGKAELERAGYFGDELSPAQRVQFRDEDNGYKSQLPPDEVKTQLAPIEADWAKLIHKVDFRKAGKDPTNEECWYAEEDIWVQRELLNIVKAAAESASKFEDVARFKLEEISKAEREKLSAAAAPAGGTAAPATPPAPAPGGTAPGAEEKKSAKVERKRFHNPHWQLDLVIEENEKKELTVTPQTTIKVHDVLPEIDRGRALLPAAGLDIRLGQPNNPRGPQPQTLHFEGGKAGAPLALAKALPLPGFAANLDNFPLDLYLTADKSDPEPPADTKRWRFRNPYWEFEVLVVAKKGVQPVISGDSKLTNIDATRRTLALGSARFKVRQGNGQFLPIDVSGYLLPWMQSKTLGKPVPISYDPALPLEVEQAFSWATSPIKGIKALEIPGCADCTAFNAHRTSNLMLKPAAQFPIEEGEKKQGGGPNPAGMGGAAGAAGGAGGAAGGARGGAAGAAGMGGAGGMSGGPVQPGTGGTGGTATETSKTPNGIVRNRYIAVTEQVRHMPVALSVVVEQGHMQDVLTAVTNSRLRIQITQVQWKRAEGIKPGSIAGSSGSSGGATERPVTSPTPGTTGGPNYGGTPGYGPPGGVRPSGPPIGGGIGGGVPGTGTPAPGVMSEQGDPNLVELAVYGIAALYERYPPKQPAKPEGAPGAPVPPK